MTKSALDVQVGGGHYKGMKIQPVEFIHANGIGFIEGCIIKYACRHRTKNGIEDLKKIKHFTDLLIDLEYNCDDFEELPILTKEFADKELPSGTKMFIDDHAKKAGLDIMPRHNYQIPLEIPEYPLMEDAFLDIPEYGEELIVGDHSVFGTITDNRANKGCCSPSIVNTSVNG